MVAGLANLYVPLFTIFALFRWFPVQRKFILEIQGFCVPGNQQINVNMFIHKIPKNAEPYS